jgi:hypothetical protein
VEVLAVFAAAAVISLFFLVVARVRRATRPATPLPGSPDGGLSGSGSPAGTLPSRESPAAAPAGPESPAVVDLLVNGWKLTATAAAATFVDLAERGHLECDSETVRPVGHRSDRPASHGAALSGHRRRRRRAGHRVGPARQYGERGGDRADGHRQCPWMDPTGGRDPADRPGVTVPRRSGRKSKAMSSTRGVIALSSGTPTAISTRPPFACEQESGIAGSRHRRRHTDPTIMNDERRSCGQQSDREYRPVCR